MSDSTEENVLYSVAYRNVNLARKAGRETAIVITDSGTRGDAI
ncbi:hypothetical protein QIG80_22590 [Klebsiella pneumoniae]|nr:hypothetical protein [Klebsiella pneumoniae]MDH8425113.1 hypothetical protein [Klebsiella pneumoniae]